jgi:dihydroorotate dehydrogenase
MMSLYKKLRPLLFHLDAEWAHDRAIEASWLVGSLWPIRAGLGVYYGFTNPRLETHVCGIQFPNPIGLAPGYDKNGQAIKGLSALGFGHLEIGSISRDSSPGNPKPRLFRLPLDRAIVVYYGLPNDGADAVAARLKNIRPLIPLGINIVKTNRGMTAPPESDDEIIADYVYSARIFKDLGDYLCLNLSCPNTRDGINFFADTNQITRLLAALSELDIRCPVFLKISPLGGVRAIENLLETIEGVSLVSGFVFNLAPGKPDKLLTPSNIVEPLPGAISGKPVEQQLNECIHEMYRRMDRNRYRIIGSGGVSSAEDAYRKIRLGASLVQLLTGMVYEGPGIAREINRKLCRLLERDGFANVAEAVGAANDS